MAANVETMFYVRKAPWHGLGTRVEQELTSYDALKAAGLDWLVTQRNVYTSDGEEIPNYKVNVRTSDNQVLGVVTDRYQIVQNYEAFSFTDELLGDGVRYETAGSLQQGKKIWLLAKLPERYIINGDEIEPFLVFSNAHDGSAAIRVAMTPVRVVCQNTLNLALRTAKRSWSAKHTANIQSRLHEARETLELAQSYMVSLGKEFDNLNKIKLSDAQVSRFISELIPISETTTGIQEKNAERQREDIWARFYEAPDLKHLDRNGYRFINAVSDFATHSKPLRETANYRENLLSKTFDGIPMIDKVFAMLKEAA